MKAIIVEINKKYAVALDKNGAFIKISNTGNYEVGSEIELPSKPVVNIGTLQKLSSIAAAVLLFISLGLGVYGYAMPYSYITVDINPSIEITSNVFDRIIKVEALNSDALKIIDGTKYSNKSVNEGIDLILNNATKEGYLTDESKNAVMITVSGKSEKKVDELKKSIQVEAKSELKDENVKAEILVENVEVKKHDDARKAGISPGKLLLIERLQEVDPKAKVEDYKDTPVKQIMKSIQAAKRQEKNEKKENGLGNEKENNKNKEDRIDKEKIKDKDTDVQGEKAATKNNDIKNPSPDVHRKAEPMTKKDDKNAEKPSNKRDIDKKNKDGKEDNDKRDGAKQRFEGNYKDGNSDKEIGNKNLDKEDSKENKERSSKWDKRKDNNDWNKYKNMEN